jgi:Zn-dependent peptidase ImmA (M78 family)
MRKPDDCSLTPAQRAKVRAEAERALRESGALGIFPTPIADIMSVAKVEEVKEDVLNETFIQKLRAKALGAGQSLKTALSKVLGLFHASEGLVFIDKSLMEVKKRFIRLHESAHGFLSWQRSMYAVVEDCEHSLDPDVAEIFDREANVFASEVLFQLDTFIEEAQSKEFSVFVPVKMSTKYGASLYASIRQYVSKSTKACVVLVLNPPELVAGNGFKVSLRRPITSESFDQIFGNINWPNTFTPDDKIGAMVPLGSRRASGKRSMGLTDANGVQHECVAEAFTNTYQVFILIHAQSTMTKTTIILPASFKK